MRDERQDTGTRDSGKSTELHPEVRLSYPSSGPKLNEHPA